MKKTVKSKIRILLLYLILVNIFIFWLFIFLNGKEGFSSLVYRMFRGSNHEVANASKYYIKVNEYSPKVVKLKEFVKIDAPIIKQFPELPRGCEVTSLAMLLQYKGINVDKMELAEKVEKNVTPFKNENGRIIWGNPNDGFVGDMYSYSNPGYGVYNEPIKKLAEQYLPGQIVNLSGRDFSELKTYLSLDIPVWVIINTTYKTLPEETFQKWYTPRGDIKVTYKEHSVLITGYDKENIYFNDPISGIKNKSIPKEDFIPAWKQMGSQAVTYLPE